MFHFSKVNFFIVNQNAPSYIRDQSCHLQSDEASLFYSTCSRIARENDFCFQLWLVSLVYFVGQVEFYPGGLVKKLQRWNPG